MNHFNTITRAAHWGATIAALVVAFGASIGFHDMTGSWAIAILGGVGIASLLAVGWFVLISMGARVRRASAKVMTITLGAFLVAAALGTSGWALATAIGGKQALANYQTASLTEHEIALAEAMGRVNGQYDLVDAVNVHAAATIALASEEGLSGQGPLFRSYERTASNLRNAASEMGSTLDGAAVYFDSGIASLDEASTSLGNAEAFRLAMSDVEAAIVALNSVDVTGEILSIGMVGLNDKGLPELDVLTSSLRAIGEDAEAAPVTVPRYTPMTRSEATIVMFPVGAWIAAVAIDTAPLLLLMMVMIAALEPLMRDERKIKARKTDDEIRVAEEDVAFSAPRVVAE